jgi:cytidylate kinase
MKKGFAIAIDGPVASGKGTISKLLAKELNAVYLDTGAMYRCVALYLLEQNIDYKDESKVIPALEKINIEISRDKIFLNSLDVSAKIRTYEVDLLASPVSGIVEVRRFLVGKQQEIAKSLLENGELLIAEGRDVATNVLPNADLKIYLTASEEIRAKRRYQQYQERDIAKSLEEVDKDTRARDNQDININHSLVSDPKSVGYFVIDDSELSKAQTLEIILGKIKEIKND